jgi:hypothetical protein
MHVINFKASFLNKCILWLILIGVFVIGILFLTLNIAPEYIYFLSMLFIFSGILIVFYLNRFEPTQIQLVSGHLTVSFFNKFFFKKKEANYSKSELKASIKNDIITLSKNNLTVIIIRKASLDLKYWEYLRDILIS